MANGISIEHNLPAAAGSKGTREVVYFISLSFHIIQLFRKFEIGKFTPFGILKYRRRE